MQQRVDRAKLFNHCMLHVTLSGLVLPCLPLYLLANDRPPAPAPACCAVAAAPAAACAFRCCAAVFMCRSRAIVLSAWGGVPDERVG